VQLSHPRVRVNGVWVSLLTLVLVVAVLWAGKAILLPLALGIILAFALTPAVKMFDRYRLPRFAGVALTMLFALGIVGGIGYVVVDQFAELSTQLTHYTSSMRRKVAELRPGGELKRLVAMRSGPRGDVLEAPLGHTRGQEAELHVTARSRLAATSTQRSSRAEASTASVISAARRPSRNVGIAVTGEPLRTLL